jgi:hypothetical protein
MRPARRRSYALARELPPDHDWRESSLSEIGSRRAVNRGAREDGVRHGKVGWREGAQHRRGPLGVFAQREVFRGRTPSGKQPATDRLARPPAQRGPPTGRRGAYHRERADAASHPRCGQAQQRPERQRQSDRRGGIQSPPQDLPGHHQHAGAAALALEAPCPHRRHRRAALGRLGAPHLTLACPVAVNDQIPARRTARHPAAHAPRRPNRRYRRHLRLPRLDADRTPANPLAAPHLHARSSTRRGPPRSPFASPFCARRHDERSASGPPPTASFRRAVPTALPDPEPAPARSRPSRRLREHCPRSLNQGAR